MVKDKFKKQTLKVLRKQYSKSYEKDKRITLSEIDDFQKMIYKNGKESCGIIEDELSNETFLATLSIQSIYYLFLYIRDEKKLNSVLPTNWGGDSLPILPDNVLSYQFSQIVNHSISILQNCRIGLIVPARCILRVLSELIFQTLILSYKKEWFELYCSAECIHESNKIWYQLFAKGKIYNKLEELEKKLNLPNELLEYLDNLRRFIQSSYSSSIHHSFYSLTLFSTSIGVKNEKGIAILGNYSKDMKYILNHMNYMLFYFISIFLGISMKIHESINEENNNKYINKALILQDCMYELSLEYSMDIFKFIY